MKHFIEKSDGVIVEEQDISSGLYPFMDAGVRSRYRVRSIFHLIWRNPGLLHMYTDSSSLEDTSSIVRKRTRVVTTTTGGG